MELADLLVSYKQVKVPMREQVLEEAPTNKYQNMLQYMDEKQAPKVEQVQPQPIKSMTDQYGFSGWSSPSIRQSIQGDAQQSPIKGNQEFEQAYDEVEKINPEAKNYRRFLTQMAKQESGFNKSIQNRAGAPAYGYFQFMQDGKKYNNISTFANTDIETFRNNPKLQIQAAIKLAKSFEKGFNQKDRKMASEKGLTNFGLLGGAWLGGVEGVRKYLSGLGDPSDTHWSKTGAGTNVSSRIKAFNF